MKKNRGLNRYYKNLGEISFLNEFNFSGDDNSWFDFYHIHIDDTGLGNKSWKSRKQHLDGLFSMAEKVENKLKNYPKDFQYWIMIDEDDSCEDSVYIHTENPNSSLFPTLIEDDVKAEIKNERLFEYISNRGYKILKSEMIDYEDKKSTAYFLYKEHFGLKIE